MKIKVSKWQSNAYYAIAVISFVTLLAIFSLLGWKILQYILLGLLFTYLIVLLVRKQNVLNENGITVGKKRFKKSETFAYRVDDLNLILVTINLKHAFKHSRITDKTNYPMINIKCSTKESCDTLYQVYNSELNQKVGRRFNRETIDFFIERIESIGGTEYDITKI